MGVFTTHKQVPEPPIESVRLSMAHSRNEITISPAKLDPDHRQVVCSQSDGLGLINEFKSAATLDDLEAFGLALVRMAQEGRA